MSLELKVLEQSGRKYIYVSEGNTIISTDLMDEYDAAYMAADLLELAIKLLPATSNYADSINELIGKIEVQF